MRLLENDISENLTATNEILAKRYQGGDKTALTELIELNTGLIHFVIKDKFFIAAQSHYFSYDDLFQEGVIAFIKAVNNYNADKSSFSTTAIKYINWHLIRYIKQNKPKYELTLDTTVGEDDDITLIDLIADDKIDIEGEYAENALMQEIKDFISNMPEDERQFAKLHYGFYGVKLTIDETASKLGLNEYQRQRLREKTKAKLKEKYGHLMINYIPKEKKSFNPDRLERKINGNELYYSLNSFKNFMEYYDDLKRAYEEVDGYSSGTNLSLAKPTNRAISDSTANKADKGVKLKEKIILMDRLMPTVKQEIEFYINRLYGRKVISSKATTYKLIKDMFVELKSEKEIIKKHGKDYKKKLFNFLKWHKDKKPINDYILKHFRYDERPEYIDISAILYYNAMEAVNRRKKEA